jgi:23S rRNA (uracil1939-C5)-methyltransferase
MPFIADSELTLDVEKPAAGGRMLARHDGRVVLVLGAIPGERVRARVQRVSKHVLYAEVIEAVTSSPDRRDVEGDWRCGGNVFAYIAYERQRGLKGEIIRDALERIGRMPIPRRPDVMGSPEHGYRMRARLHARDGRLGFFREGTHELCDARSTRQLLQQTGEWIAAAEGVIQREHLSGLDAIEVAENIPGDARACHLDLKTGADPSRFSALAAGLTGLSATRADGSPVQVLAGVPTVSDVLHVKPNDPATAFRLRRDARAFFQGNRFLLESLIRSVVKLVPPGPVVDLYAGVGLFGLGLAATGASHVTLVEGDPVSGASLSDNAEPFGARVEVIRRSVEAFLQSRVARVPPFGDSTFLVDPPRTGLSKEAMAGIVRARPSRVVYVSCDVATFARDTRTLLDAGYELDELTGIDLFPNTAHVETVAAFTRTPARALEA